MKRITIIDDDNLVTSTYQNRLTSEGCEVSVAADGESGIKLVGEFKPDAILLDLGLPTISGVDVIKALRSSPATQAIPIFVITNSYNRKVTDDAMAAGANKCLMKATCTPRLVCDTVLGFLANKARQEAAAQTPAPAQGAAPSPTQDATTPSAPGAAVIAEAAPSLQQLLQNHLKDLRQNFQVFFKERNVKTCGPHLTRLQSIAKSISKQAALSGWRDVSQLASGAEMLFQELREKPKNITPSTIRTGAQAVDLLVELIQHASTSTDADSSPGLPPYIVAVDDDTVCRSLISYAMEKAGLNVLTLKSPTQALDVITDNRFDLIFLDVTMPEMSGYELCAKIRQIENYQHTPVIFVTGLSDFQNRAQSAASGGTDFITKPFVMVELVVKCLIHLSKGALRPGAAESFPAA